MNAVREIRFLRCRACARNRRAVWTAGSAIAAPSGAPACPSFIRPHWHIEGACAKWAGLREGDPLVCACGGAMEPFIVAGRFSETPCGGICRSARGASCECLCGGANHGTG